MPVPVVVRCRLASQPVFRKPALCRLFCFGRSPGTEGKGGNVMAACTYAMAPDQKDTWQDGQSPSL